MHCRLNSHAQLVMAFALMSFGASAASAEDQSDVVRAVKAAEQRYRRFDCLIHSEYRHLGIDRMVDSGSDLITAEDNSIRVRVEGLKFRTDTDRAITTPHTPMQFKRVRAFDGATTRATEALVANVKEGAQTEDHLIRPHTAVFAYASMSAPLESWSVTSLRFAEKFEFELLLHGEFLCGLGPVASVEA